MRLGDLFQRAYETASLANVDMLRTSPDTMGDPSQRAGNDPKFADLPTTRARDSMTPSDRTYFDPDKDISSPPSREEPLPLSSVAQQVHGARADTDDLELLLRSDPARVQRMIRPAYARFKDLAQDVKTDQHPLADQRDPRISRDRLHDMRMPPYMRDSDATALSLNRRQYEFLMDVVRRLREQPPEAKLAAAGSRTNAHVARVVERRKAVAASTGSRVSADTTSPNKTREPVSNKSTNKPGGTR